MKNKIIQDLDLTIGERAKSTAGYPHKGTVVVECIKNFADAPSSDHIFNNIRCYIKVVDSGRFGLLTSHLISANWTDEIF